MNKTLFDWRWDDEPSQNKYQLVVPRKTKYGTYTYEEGKFTYYDDEEGEKEVIEEKYFMKMRYEFWYRKADPLDIEPFLEHHLNFLKRNRLEFLKYLQTITETMDNLSERKDEFKKKRKKGKELIEEKIIEVKKETDSFSGPPPVNHQQYTFDDIFFNTKLTGDQLIKQLQPTYIDKDFYWLRGPHNFKGLVHFLIEKDLVRTNKYATVQKVLLTRLKASAPSRPADAPGKKTIEQYEEVVKY